MWPSSRAPAEHAITERQEAIPLAQRVCVRGPPCVVAGERREQNQQGRSRLMKVREQPVNDAKAVPWTNEQAGASARRAGNVAIIRARLEDPDHGGADRDHSPPGPPRAFDRVDGGTR